MSDEFDLPTALSTSELTSINSDDSTACNSIYTPIRFDQNIVRFSYFILHIPFLICIGFFGLLGNSLAIIVLSKEKPFSSTSVLLVAIAVADNLVLLANLLQKTIVHFNYYWGAFILYREFHEVAYSYLYTSVWFAKTTSIYLTVFVAAERFIAVCLPLRAAAICTKKKAYLVVFLVCILSFMYRIPLMFMYEASYLYDACSGTKKPWYVTTKLYSNPYYRIIYVLLLHTIINSLSPIIFLIVVTSCIISTLKRAAHQHLSCDARQANDNMKSTTVRVLAVVVVFVILETPGGVYQILSIIITYGNVNIHSHIGSFTNVIGYFLNVLNSFVNFYIYFLTGSSFRRATYRLFTCHRR
jgi:hypothetical protein